MLVALAVYTLVLSFVGSSEMLSIVNFKSMNNEKPFSPLCPATACPPMQRAQASPTNHSMSWSLQVQQLRLFSVSFLQLSVSAPPANLRPETHLACFLPSLVFIPPLWPPLSWLTSPSHLQQKTRKVNFVAQRSTPPHSEWWKYHCFLGNQDPTFLRNNMVGACWDFLCIIPQLVTTKFVCFLGLFLF